MRFLADECLHVEMVAVLRRAGHTVATVAPDSSGASEIAPAPAGASDEAVLRRAAHERTVLLTAEDFGEIATRRGTAVAGMVPFRRSVAITPVSQQPNRFGEAGRRGPMGASAAPSADRNGDPGVNRITDTGPTRRYRECH